MNDASGTLRLGEWLAELRRAAGMAPEAYGVDAETERAILDLTRIAAHRSERIAAPISAFLLGMAAAEMRENERAPWIRSVAAALEAAGE